ncbi:MAG: hypothetical protein COA63_008120 [Methylophaga sp.]|nr:hypothetical protein [Methylophaga sp.]
MKHLIVFLLLIFSTGAYASSKSIYIVLSSEDAIYYKIGSQLKEHISNSSFPTEQISIITLDDKRFNTIKPNDLIVPIGSKAVEASYQYQSSNTIIYSFVEQELIDKINLNKQSGAWAAVTVNQPVRRLISIADSLVKSNYKNKIVILVSRNNTQLKHNIDAFGSLKKGQIEIVEIGPDDIVPKVVDKSLFNAAVLITTDEEKIWSGSNAKWLLRQAYNYQVPVVGNSKRFLKAGALISVYSSMEQISETTSLLVKQWLADGMLTSTGIQDVPGTIDINSNIAQVLHYNKNVLQTLEVDE